MKRLLSGLLAVCILAMVTAGCASGEQGSATATPSLTADATMQPSPTATIDKSRPTNIDKYYEFTKEDWDELSDSQKITLVSTLILDASPDIEESKRNSQAEALVTQVAAALTGSKTLKEAFDSLYTPSNDQVEPTPTATAKKK